MVHIVNDPIEPHRRRDYVFTPERANLMLPLVRRIARDILDLQRTIDSQADQVKGLERFAPEDSDSRTELVDEVRDVRDSLDANQARMSDLVAELGELGISMHPKLDGYFDFPALIGRREVQLCWHPDEPSVTHWHEGISGRRIAIDGQVFDTAPN